MFCHIQMKMALQNKISETECHHWKLLDSSWCACACAYTFTHTLTHSWLYTTLGITRHTLCPVSNILEETMFQILDLFLLSGMRMERHLLSWVWLRKPITITVHPTSDTSSYIRTYDHNPWWYHFSYLPQTKLDGMCRQTGSFMT
jgi:hypothetical protein